MATPVRSGIVYRNGNPTPMNFTPRLKDCVADPPSPASEPGLSTFVQASDDARSRQMEVNLALLPANLSGFADDPSLGGIAGHVSIAPITLDDSIDHAALSEWAASRGGNRLHRLTIAVMRAAGFEVRVDDAD